MKFKHIAIVIIFGILFSNCNEKHNGYDEGELVYNIKYLQNESENPLVALLPKTVSIKFKNDNTVIYIEGFFGTFQLKFIANFKEQKSYTVLRIMDKKYLSENHIDSLNAGYENFSDMQLTSNEDTATLGGLLSHEAIVVCKSMCDTAFKIYYTYDVDIKNPNSNSPYHKVDGILTKFRTRVAGIDMIFELKEFNKIKIDDNEFIAPTDYKIISKQELNDILKSFQE